MVGKLGGGGGKAKVKEEAGGSKNKVTMKSLPKSHISSILGGWGVGVIILNE